MAAAAGITTAGMAARSTAIQVRTIILCGIVAAIDGFDTQAIGFTGPLIAADLGFDRALLGWVFSAGLLGAMTGAFVFGPLADRIGRARMLVVSCLFVGGFTAVTMIAPDFRMLLVCRFLTGVGLGGATPCFMGLGVEAVPEQKRRAMSAMLYATFPMGAVLGSLASAPILAHYGWRGVFAMGAGLPLVMAVVLMLWLREPPRAAGRGNEVVGVRALFADGRTAFTLALWPMFALGFSAIILLSLWMPPLMQQLGVPPARTGLLAAGLNAGSVTVSLLVGWLMARFGIARVLFPALIAGAIGWGAISLFHPWFGALLLAVTLAGAAIGGATTGFIVIASTAYPAHVRATGIGWAMGFSRMGQMCAPPVVGALVAAQVSPETILLWCALPLLLAMVPLGVVVRQMGVRA